MLVARTTRAGQIELQEEPEPVRGPGQVLICPHTVTLCGTDLHIWQDDYASELPIIQGHEFSAVVESAQVGALDAEGNPLETGDIVAVSPMIWCGSCYACRVGRTNACRRMSVLGCYQDGALAELLTADPSSLYLLPDGLHPASAALTEPISISLQAVARGRPEPGERAVVLGSGPIGLFAVRRLSDLGVEVLAVDTVASRLELAVQFGATRTLQLDPSVPFPSSEYTELSEQWTEGDGPSLVIEATGMAVSLVNAVEIVAAAGRVVCVGISDQQMQTTMRQVPIKELDLLGSRNSNGLMGESLRFLTRHGELVSSLVTHTFPFEQIDRALATMADPTQAVGKIAVQMPGAQAPQLATAQHSQEPR